LRHSKDVDRKMYVVNLFPNKAPVPQNFIDVMTRMMTLAFSNKSQTDVDRAQQTRDIILFMNKLEKFMEQNPELSKLKDEPGYKVIKEFAHPIDTIAITNVDVDGASDFSAAGIERRRAAGYKNALETLNGKD
jgi:isopentenyl diphosphate isomerase/L-lactate dehydrogenase-like FMN-dependent dehydrogenase